MHKIGALNLNIAACCSCDAWYQARVPNGERET